MVGEAVGEAAGGAVVTEVGGAMTVGVVVGSTEGCLVGSGEGSGGRTGGMLMTAESTGDGELDGVGRGETAASLSAVASHCRVQVQLSRFAFSSVKAHEVLSKLGLSELIVVL